MPNPGKPIAIKLISGSRRIRNATVSLQLPALAEVPCAPEWLPNEHSRKEWQRLAPILQANKLLSEVALSVLGHACAMYGVLARSWASGQVPKAASLAVYRQLVSDFGMTPVSATKAHVGGAPALANPFHRHGRRPA